MADAALQRKNMVESQIRPSDVTDRRITAAMMAIPREKFLPARLADLAYSDENLTVGQGREILSPRVLAKLIQLAEFDAKDNVLVISEAGYAAAVIAELAGSVVTLFTDSEGAAAATDAFASLAIANASAAVGAAASGWQPKAPYDVVFIEGGIETVPDSLKTQIRDNGRLIAVGMDDNIGRAVVLHKRGELLARRDAFQTAAAVLPGFKEAKPAFVF
jgi:protein-L-isoaspartate(D-aspartate) O-methyltransferase